jgi:hypothetical protein
MRLLTATPALRRESSRIRETNNVAGIDVCIFVHVKVLKNGPKIFIGPDAV